MRIQFYQYLFLIPFLFLISCQSSGVETIDVRPIDNWSSEQGISFKNIPNKPGNQLAILLEYTDEYAFENLYLSVKLSIESTIIEEQIISIQLLDNNGQWIGQKSGSSMMIQYPIEFEYSSENTEIVHLEIFQHSREDVLKHIKSIGVGKIS